MRYVGESVTLDHGVNRHGIHTKLIFQGDEVVKKQTFDAAPFLEMAHAQRVATAGDRWGEMRKVGTIPMAIYVQALEIKDQKDRQRYILRWLKENPLMVTFDKFLKK